MCTSTRNQFGLIGSTMSRPGIKTFLLAWQTSPRQCLHFREESFLHQWSQRESFDGKDKQILQLNDQTILSGHQRGNYHQHHTLKANASDFKSNGMAFLGDSFRHISKNNSNCLYRILPYQIQRVTYGMALNSIENWSKSKLSKDGFLTGSGGLGSFREGAGNCILIPDIDTGTGKKTLSSHIFLKNQA